MLERLKTAIPLIVLFALCFLLPGAYGMWYFSFFAVLALVLANREIYVMLKLPRPFEIGAALMAVFSVVSCLLWRGYEPLPLLCVSHLLLSVCILFGVGLSKENLNGLFLSLGIFLYINCMLL